MSARQVLILIVVEDGLVQQDINEVITEGKGVLILIVVEDGLVHGEHKATNGDRFGLNPYCSGRWSRTQLTSHLKALLKQCLNPYCSGRWSRTRPYKTLLIINKLKSFTKQILTFLNRKLTIA